MKATNLLWQTLFDISKRFGVLVQTLAKFLGYFLLFAYRILGSFSMGGHCRMLPTCSCYAEECLRTQTPVRALALIFRRLTRCHPWGPVGWDPVPEVRKST